MKLQPCLYILHINTNFTNYILISIKIGSIVLGVVKCPLLCQKQAVEGLTRCLGKSRHGGEILKLSNPVGVQLTNPYTLLMNTPLYICASVPMNPFSAVLSTADALHKTHDISQAIPLQYGT